MTLSDKLDLWLDRYPKIDHAYTEVYIKVQQVKHAPRHAYDNWRERRFWTPGSFYLDHGYTPCVLTEMDQYGTLEGVSLVDGKVIGGCSIHHCGPEKVSRKEAMNVASAIKKMEKK